MNTWEYYAIAGMALALILILWLVARVSFWRGVRDTLRVIQEAPVEELVRRRPGGKKREAADEPVPDVFKSGEERRKIEALRKRKERAGYVAWNARRPGLSAEEREALLYQLEEGKLDPAIEQVIREAMGEKS